MCKDCVYCNQEIEGAAVFVGGEAMHPECEKAFRHHFDEAAEASERDAQAERDAEGMMLAEAEGECFHSHFDDDPSVYDGNYSEE